MKAPWKDFAGDEIHEGDIIEHPNGLRGTVICMRVYDDDGDRWRVKYHDGSVGYARLCLQIGDKGRAVVAGRRSGDSNG